jgi:dTDP-glucose pyrophosphorylase
MEIALVYIVAGLSSRFGGKPKFFVKVKDDETLIEHSLKQALPAGFSKIIFVVGKHTEALFREKFGNNYMGIPVFYAFQEFDVEKRDKPWGTADALCSAEKIIDCPFVMCNGDDLYGKEAFQEIVRHFKDKNTCVTLGYKLGEVLSEKGGVNRGIFKVKNNIIESVTEIFNITKENLSVLGVSENDLVSQQIWGFSIDALKKLKENVIAFKKRHEGDRKSECLLPTELNDLIQNKKITIEIYPTKSKWVGITYPEDEFEIQKNLKKIN